MGYCYSSCKEKKIDEEESPSDVKKGQLPEKENSTNIKSERFISNQNQDIPAKKVNYAKLTTGGDNPYMFSDNSEVSYISDDMRRSHVDYESYTSPTFQSRNQPIENNLPLNEDHQIETTSNFGRFSVVSDKSFDGDYDQSFDNSYINQADIEKDYVSMSSILIKNDKKSDENDDVDLLDINNISNALTRKSYIIVYLEFNYFMLWGWEYIRSVYPENNIILIAQLNDDVTTSERIPLIKSEEKYKWKPMLKKDEKDKKSYKTIKFLFDDNTGALHRKPLKLSVEVAIYAMNKISTVSYEEFFFNSNSETEMHKYILYPNTYMKYNNKKMGNLNFTLMFKLDRLNISSKEDEISLSEKYYHIFNRKDRLITFSEDPNLQLRYYEIPNSQYKSLSGKSDFMSLKDIPVEIESYLKNESISIDKLLDLISENNTKYELYELLKMLHDRLCKKEFSDEKLSIFKEKLNKVIQDVRLNKDGYDKIVIPFVYNLFRRSFFKVNKVLPKDKAKNKGETKNFTLHDIEIIKNVFIFSFNYINPSVDSEISLSALNFISKIIEENFPMLITNDKKVNSEEFFISYIIKKKKYLDLCEMLLYMSDYPACAMPISMILSKILKLKKDETKELVGIIKQDKFKEVFKQILETHDCNSIIMTNMIAILLQTIDFIEVEELFQIITFSKLKEIFYTFKTNGFDIIHDSIIGLIKAILVKKSATANKSMTLTLDDSDYANIILIFIFAVNLIKTRILMTNDFNRVARSLYNLLSHVYTICNIINNINEKNELSSHKLCIEKKLPEILIDCINAINDKKIFTNIDTAFDKTDISSLNTKMIIFRALYHCILLIQNLRKVDSLSISKPSAEKFYKIIKILEDNDAIYNPQNIMKNYEKIKGKPDEQFKSSAKNLLDYYGRYKQKLPEFADELISILKG
jgi:hypothetical protein